VTDTTPQSTLRQLRAHLTAPKVLAVQAGVAVVLGLSGPFETFALLALPVRLAYWTAVVFGTYATGTAVVIALEGRGFPNRLARPLRIAATGAAIGVAVCAVLVGLGAVAFGPAPLHRALSPTVVTGAFVVAWVVLILREVLSRAPPPAPPDAGGAGTPPGAAILRRLPLGKRGALIALSAEDHYVAVLTTRGRQLVLMRLSDAIAEAGGIPGLQVHRSHWVALDQVRDAARQGDGAVLTLTDGSRIPVSRARLAAVRAAGLVPA